MLVVASVCIQLCACQANPSSTVVISKNDGSFDENLLETAPSVEKSNGNIQYIDEFLSTDRSIEYTLNINRVLNTTTKPVVEVVPHKFLSEDVKSVANVLFDGGTFYEREPTKNQIQNAIVRFLLIRSSLLCIYSKLNYRWFSG